MRRGHARSRRVRRRGTRSRTSSGASATASSSSRSGIAGTSRTGCARSRTTRSWRLWRRRSAAKLSGMTARETVQIWRAADLDGVLAIAGTTSSYAVDPRAGELIGGAIDRGHLRVRRARTRYELAAGGLVMWDVSNPHAGSARTPWASRLVVFETASIQALFADDAHPRDLEIRKPVPQLPSPER